MLQGFYVCSSNIEAVGYQYGSLYIRFHHGGCYQYDRVPHSTYTQLIEAESPGQYFHREIRGKFEFKKLDFDPFEVRKAA